MSIQFEGIFISVNDLSKKQTEISHKVSNVEDGVKTLEEMNVTNQNDMRKIDSKVRKVKNLLDTSMEGLEDKINFPIQEVSSKLETELRQVTVTQEDQTKELKRRLDEIENCDLVNFTRRLGTARNKINEIIEKTSEIDLQIKEIHRDKSSNLLLHSLPCPVSHTAVSPL